MRKSKKIIAVVLSLILAFSFSFMGYNAKAAQVYYNNTEGNDGAYTYVLWKDYGDTSMTVKGGGTFECWWQNIGNALFREGVKFDCTKTYQQIGNISINYGVDYQPNGNSYLCVYGWTRNPLVEYYIVESWGTWRPPGASSKGTITVDGGTYEVYETTRYNQPSIDGDTTFQQYWSVRTSKRTSGTITVTDHFRAWEQMGMRMGNLYEASLNIEGYQSSGWADVYSNTVTVGGSGNSGNYNNGGNNGGYNNGGNNGGNSGGVQNSDGSGSAAPGTNQGTVFECENMTKSGQYTGNISSPFNGVALYANNDAISTNVNFTSGTHDITLRGASDGDNLAQVDLVIGNQTKGTFYFGDANTAEYTIKNVNTGTGNQTVKLVVTADNSGNNNSGNNWNNNNNGNNNSGTGASATVKQAEDMQKSGQYTGNINNPFGGVALYANNDAVSYTQYFSEGTHDFTLRGASNNSQMAKVDLVIGNQTKGTFYFGDANAAEYTIKNVSHGTGNQTVKLVVTADDGNWDAYVDYLSISGAGTVQNENGANAGNTYNANNNAGNNTANNQGSNAGNTGNIDPNGKMIALTFDDGPSATTTGQVLDVLDRYGVKATFFLMGQNINDGTRAIMQRQNSAGHELANHSFTHSDMTRMSYSAIQDEINRTNNLIRQYTGQTPKFFRPPYISINNTMYQAIDLAFVQGAMLNDWENGTSVQQRVNNALNAARDGQIIMLHDFEGNYQTVQALSQIIEGLKNQGYQFVTLSELFQYKGKNANQEYKIWSNVFN